MTDPGSLFSPQAQAQAVVDVRSPVADALIGTGPAPPTSDTASSTRAATCPCGQPRDDGRHLIAAADVLGNQDRAN